MGRPPAILLHAGAGPRSDELLEHEDEFRETLEGVLADAAQALGRGAPALEVAVAAVRALEAFELFNAGVGSALCSDGSVQMSAALMHGPDRAGGAVAGIRTLEHAIDGARFVLESEQVLMIGESAECFAAERGAVRLPESAFVTERQRERLIARTGDQHGTVGAVCLDREGALVAATSTGGISGQPSGRVGDSPLLGAGTWADSLVAISCTGDGEAFIRSGAALRIALLVADGVPVAEAAGRTLADVGELGGTGGLIALTADGAATLPFTTAAMPRGLWRAGGPPCVRIGPDD
jgi:beta-aspartyl-peptidase (threonine type)